MAVSSINTGGGNEIDPPPLPSTLTPPTIFPLQFCPSPSGPPVPPRPPCQIDGLDGVEDEQGDTRVWGTNINTQCVATMAARFLREYEDNPDPDRPAPLEGHVEKKKYIQLIEQVRPEAWVRWETRV